jgi:hypothetical protein
VPGRRRLCSLWGRRNVLRRQLPLRARAPSWVHQGPPA